jgi:hypothetical protein
MQCPKCQCWKSIVIDSRGSSGLSLYPDSNRRRRQCMDCRYKWTTSEWIVRAQREEIQIRPLWIAGYGYQEGIVEGTEMPVGRVLETKAG